VRHFSNFSKERKKKKMLTLYFLVVGEGSVFPVEIDEGKTVGVLKEEIKKKKKLFDQYDADELTIYLAKKDDHWLPSDDDDEFQLKRGDVPMDIRTKYLKPEMIMDPTEDLDYYFGEGNTPSKKQIHGLVVVPTAVTEKPEIPDSSKCYSCLCIDSADPYMNVPCSSDSDH